MAATDKNTAGGQVGVGAEPEKKERKKRTSFARKPTELAIVATVKDENGEPIPGAVLEVLLASKDISGAFKLHKATPGSDMITFTMQPNSQKAEVEKQA